MLTMDEATVLRVLTDLGAIPTAPLHEQAVAAYVVRFLRNNGLPFQVDPYGNIIATYRHGKPTQPLALVAHLDHPAFEITIAGPDRIAQGNLLGGVPAACFDRPVPALVISEDTVANATIIGYDVNRQTGRVASLSIECAEPVRVGAFGVFDLGAPRRDDEQIAMPAADDLAGVAAALLTLSDIAASHLDGTVYGVFTRAEEIGLVGASLVAQQKLLPLDTIVVSLECSRELPGAQPGLGPVIRVGDRTRAFHPDGEAVLLAARERLVEVPVQRQLMSGGTCEATAFGSAGYRTTGVALPLINYHNVGPGDVIAPERINVRDFIGEVALLSAAVQVAGDGTPLTSELNLQQRTQQFHERLRDTASTFHDL